MFAGWLIVSTIRHFSQWTTWTVTWAALSCIDFVSSDEQLKRTKLKNLNVTTQPPWKRKRLPFSLYYRLNIGHFWPACGCRTNSTLSNTVISVSINAEAGMSVKRISVSLRVLHGWQQIWKKCINSTMEACRTGASTFYGIPKMKRNPWLSVTEGCFT